MRARPHTISTRLAADEVAAVCRALAVPGGGWFVPSHFSRWVLLRAETVTAGAIYIDAGAVDTAMRQFRTAGRHVNSLAFTLNAGVPIAPDIRALVESWPKALGAVLDAVRPTVVYLPSPAARTAAAPAMVRAGHPAFRQHPVGNRYRQMVMATRLSDMELAHVQAGARRAGTEQADFFRARLLGADPLRQVRVPRLVARALAAALGEAGRQASNWRQVARVHEGRRWAMPELVPQALRLLWDLRNAITPTLSRWRA